MINQHQLKGNQKVCINKDITQKLVIVLIDINQSKAVLE